MENFKNRQTECDSAAFAVSEDGYACKKAELLWQELFTEEKLKRGKQIADHGKVDILSCDRTACRANVTVDRETYRVLISKFPGKYSDSWDEISYSCTCTRYGKRSRMHWYSSYYDRNYADQKCEHEAAVMYAWEKIHGPWIFTETEEEREARLEEEKRERIRAKRQKEREEKEQHKLTLDEVYEKYRIQKDTLYNLPEAEKEFTTNLYCADRYRDIQEKSGAELKNIKLVGYGSQNALGAEFSVWDGLENCHGELKMTEERIVRISCSCQRRSFNADSYYENNREICEHELAALCALEKYIGDNDPGEATDRFGERFIKVIGTAENSDDSRKPDELVVQKAREVELRPRVILEDQKVILGYKVGLKGGKLFVVRNPGELTDAVAREGELVLGKNTTLDFSKMDFTEEGEKWADILMGKVLTAQETNQQIRNRYYNLSIKASTELSGTLLEDFYKLAENTSCESQIKSEGRNTVSAMRVGDLPFKVKVTVYPIIRGDHLYGVRVTGRAPRVLDGTMGRKYVVTETSLSPLHQDAEQIIRPFINVAAVYRCFAFSVGKYNLQEFYYRIIPRLMQSPYIDLNDQCAEQVEAVLPPEPDFVFYLDAEENRITCYAEVSYDGLLYRVPGDNAAAGAETVRDWVQEKRVEQTIRQFFPEKNAGKFSERLTEERLYEILTEGIRTLEQFGTVKGSDVFLRNRVRSAPAVTVGVSVDSDLLDISILSKDTDPEELLQILESYRLRKKYHRLRNGDYIALAGNEQYGDLEELMTGMDLSAEDVINGGGRIPLYRAMYVDRLLEEHEGLAADRDRTFRTLVRNFRTISDAEYEAPEDMTGILRGYQDYGYKWLRTVAGAGFGGILADEMGLGKTVQMIAAIAGIEEDGEREPSLVICPASLVYNWQEEVARFAPNMRVEVLAGGIKARREVFSRMKNKTEQIDIYITSYDLCKRDIENYAGMFFSAVVLDEAQYIKNAKAAVTKAVKVIHARHRFALTGTPIENRLSELWSIFDFLMPGFLYQYDTFSRDYEIPITKEKNSETMEKLRKMVSPFILRRLKHEVLKDLPEKLEEIRYARFEDSQREVYDGQVVRMKQMISSDTGRGENKIRILAELTRIRQICCDPSLLLEDYRGGSAKREACLELIKNAMDGGHRILVFSQFTSMLALLEKDLRQAGIQYYIITGATPKEHRIRMVHEFNENNSVSVFLVSLKAGGTGLNLVGADVVIHYDPWWNLAAQNQATDRAHRIGQTREVTVYKLIVKDTIEERIMELQNTKKDLAEAILRGENESLMSMTGEELLELLS